MTSLYWHCHHDVLAEVVYDYEKRVKYIVANKPATEVELRLRLFQPVCHVPEVLAKACDKYDKAWDKYDKARGEYDKARGEYDKAWDKYDKARGEYDKARGECKQELEELHKQECPNCPWDGHTIFPDQR